MKNSIGKNFLLQLLYQILAIITPLITAPYISRVLGPNNVGVNAYAYAIISYFLIVSALGITNYGSRALAEVRDNREKLSRLFTEIFVVHFLVSLVVIVAYLVYCFVFITNHRSIFILQIFHLLSITFDISWLFFAVEDFKVIVIKNCILKVLSVIATLLFVNKEEDLPIYVFILAFTAFLNNAVLWTSYKKYADFTKVTLSEAKRHFKPLCILFLPVIATTLYKYIDKIMLGNMCNTLYVGYYESAERIIHLIMGVVLAFGTIMLPKISYLVANGEKNLANSYYRKSIVVIGFLSIGMGAGCYGIARDFVPFFFGEGYDESIAILQVLAISIPFSSIANLVKTQYLVPNKKDIFLAVVLFSGAIINIIINALLIPDYYAWGATLGTLITEILVCLLQVMYSNSSMHTVKQLTPLVPMIIGAVGMNIVMAFVPSGINVVLKLIIEIASGGLTYLILALGLLYVYDKTIVSELLSKLHKFRR